jgi:hypothetical protein
LACYYFDGSASDEDVESLSGVLRESEDARDHYLSLAAIHGHLSGNDVWTEGAPALAASQRSIGRHPRWLHISLAAAAIFVLTGIILLMSDLFRDRQPVVAELHEIGTPRWVGRPAASEQGLRVGDRLELSKGQVRLAFLTGADVLLSGPAILEIDSENGIFLPAGTVDVTADTPESHGFIARTRTAQVIDHGTRFITQAGLDGQCQILVTSGMVDVAIGSASEPDRTERLRVGEAIGIEPGNLPVMVRIESGESSPNFAFPTIEPPTDQDDADATQGMASIKMVLGNLKSGNRPSADPAVLIDGRGQAVPDAPEASVFFENNERGRLLMDLGALLMIQKINTYSWHQAEEVHNRFRAPQKYTLYGYGGETLPETGGELEIAGWEKIVRVNSDDFFDVDSLLDRPAQQACSISGTGGVIGRYRYLLWDVHATASDEPHTYNHTFYGEFDVYVNP